MFLFGSVLLVGCAGLVTSTCCPRGWVAYDTGCYLFPRNQASSFTEAEHYCRQHHNSHLVEIDTVDENLFIKDILRGLTSENHWMALTDEQTEDVWTWVNSDTAAKWFDWAPGQPDNAHDEDCAQFHKDSDFQWNDAHCSNKCEPICELRSEGSEIIG